MNYKTWTVGIAVLTLATAPAFAEPGLGQWTYDQNVVPVACDSCCDDGCCGDDCCGDDCCGDCCCGDGCGCGCGVGGAGLFSGVGPGWLEGFSLSSCLGVEWFDIGGWTQFGYTSQPTLLTGTPQFGSGPGSSFNDIEDQVVLNQQWFYAGREADGSNGLDFGFRVDLMYGTDAGDTQAFGNPSGSWDFENGWDHGIYGWAMPQLYGEVALGDFSVIMGHFYTLVGYEVVTAPDNFFYSHALTMFNTEPFTHTGVLGTYSGFENLTLYGGWTAGWDTGFDSVNSGNNFLGGFSASLTDAITLTYINTFGNFGDIAIPEAGAARDDEGYSHSVVLDVALTDKLNYVFQSDYKKVDNNIGIDDEDVGINQYLFYHFNDVLSFGSRIEWWRDAGPGVPSGGRISNNVYTGGVNVRLLDNLIWRPEWRKEWVPGAFTGVGPYEQDIFACDMILTY